MYCACIQHTIQMRLLTHNLLICVKKKCTLNNFPLKIVDPEFMYTEEDQSELQPEQVQKLLTRIDYPTFYQTIQNLNLDTTYDIPSTLDIANIETEMNTQLIKDLYTILFLVSIFIPFYIKYKNAHLLSQDIILYYVYVMHLIHNIFCLLQQWNNNFNSTLVK